MKKTLFDYCKEWKEYSDIEIEKLAKKIENYRPFMISMGLLEKLIEDLETIKDVYTNIEEKNINKKFTDFQKGLDAGRNQILTDIDILLNKYKNLTDFEKLNKCIFCDEDTNEEDEKIVENDGDNLFKNLTEEWWGSAEDEEENETDIIKYSEPLEEYNSDIIERKNDTKYKVI